jgi:hypothetical protein
MPDNLEVSLKGINHAHGNFMDIFIRAPGTYGNVLQSESGICGSFYGHADPKKWDSFIDDATNLFQCADIKKCPTLPVEARAPTCRLPAPVARKCDVPVTTTIKTTATVPPKTSTKMTTTKSAVKTSTKMATPTSTPSTASSNETIVPYCPPYVPPPFVPVPFVPQGPHVCISEMTTIECQGVDVSFFIQSCITDCKASAKNTASISSMYKQTVMLRCGFVRKDLVESINQTDHVKAIKIEAQFGWKPLKPSKNATTVDRPGQTLSSGEDSPLASYGAVAAQTDCNKNDKNAIAAKSNVADLNKTSVGSAAHLTDDAGKDVAAKDTVGTQAQACIHGTRRSSVCTCDPGYGGDDCSIALDRNAVEMSSRASSVIDPSTSTIMVVVAITLAHIF